MADPLRTVERIASRLREAGALVERARRAVAGVELSRFLRTDLARGASFLEGLRRGGPAAGSGLVILHDVMGNVTNLSRRPAKMDRVLQRLFADRDTSATLDGLVATMTRGLPGIRVRQVEVMELLGYVKLHLKFVDQEGRFVGEEWRQFQMVRGRPHDWTFNDGRLDIVPPYRQGGIGTRLFANIIRWCWETGLVERFQFIAEKLGTVAWSRDEGIHVSSETLADLRDRVAGLNHRFTLGFEPGRIARLDTLQEVARLTLDGEPPEGVVTLLAETYRHYGVVPERSELVRRARRIGDVALLQGQYEAFMDLRRDSNDAPLFLASVDRRLAERGK